MCRKKSLAPALAPARKSLRGRAQGGRWPEAAEESKRVRAPAAGVGACARVPSPRFARAHDSSTHASTHLTDTPASPSLARDPASAGPASLSSLSFGRVAARPTQPAPACALGARARERRARARPFTFAPLRGVRARTSLIFHLPEPRALPARGGATAALPITSAPGSARPLPPAPLPPAKLLP